MFHNEGVSECKEKRIKKKMKKKMANFKKETAKDRIECYQNLKARLMSEIEFGEPKKFIKAVSEATKKQNEEVPMKKKKEERGAELRHLETRSS